MGKMLQNLKMNMDTKVMQARKAIGEIQALAISSRGRRMRLLKKFWMPRIKKTLREAFRISERSSV